MRVLQYLIYNLIKYLFMIKALVLCVLVSVVLSRSYPMFKQCDSRWGSQQLGTSSKTICQAGCAMSSVAMALAGTGHGYNPSSLNQWLKGHGGYSGGDGLVWGAVNPLGLTYHGKFGNGQIKGSLDQGKVVICNVNNGGHWVLAHSYSGDTIYVNDPGFDRSSYTLSQIVDGNNAVYSVAGASSSFINLVQRLKSINRQQPAWMTQADRGNLQQN